MNLEELEAKIFKEEPRYKNYKKGKEMKKKYPVQVGIIIGIILLMSTAECISAAPTIPFSPYHGGENHAGFNGRIFAFWRIRGDVRDLTVFSTNIHFNTTRVVESAIGVLFPIPFIPFPILKRRVSMDEEWWVVWDGPFIFHREIITDNHIDLVAILWGDWYSPGVTRYITKT